MQDMIASGRLSMNKLHTYGNNRIWRDGRNFILIGNHKICRYRPHSDTFEFQVSGTVKGHYTKRFVEVAKNEFIERLSEVLTLHE